MANFLKTLSGIKNPTAIFPDSSIEKILDDDNSQYVASIIIEGSNNREYLVKGLITDPPEIEIAATWEASDFLTSIVSNNSLLETIYKYGTTILGAGGIANPSNLGVSSKQIYNKSGYLEFSLNMRCVDWKGSGIPVISAIVLMNCCLPKKIDEKSIGGLGRSGLLTTAKTIKHLVPHITEDDANKFADAVENDIGKAGSYLNKGVEGFLGKTIADAFERSSTEFLNDPQFLVTAASPKPVKVRLGRYFYHSDMIVKSVKTTFSKQMTSYGPMYADFTIQLSSRKALLVGENEPGVGLLAGKKVGSRVTMMG